MRDFVERLRAHPEHVRHRIAVGTAVGITAVVGVVWLATLATSGTLALNLSAPVSTSSSPTIQTAVSQTKSNFDQLMGAIGVLGNNSAQPTLTPVDISSTTDSSQYSGSGDNSDQSDGNQNNTSESQISF